MSFEEARDIILSNVVPLGVEQVRLLGSIGRVIAEDRHSAAESAAVQQLGHGRLRRARRRLQQIRLTGDYWLISRRWSCNGQGGFGECCQNHDWSTGSAWVRRGCATRRHRGNR